MQKMRKKVASGKMGAEKRAGMIPAKTELAEPPALETEEDGKA